MVCDYTITYVHGNLLFQSFYKEKKFKKLKEKFVLTFSSFQFFFARSFIRWNCQWHMSTQNTYGGEKEKNLRAI